MAGTSRSMGLPRTWSPDDTDGGEDVFLHDRQTGQTTLVSVSSAGVKGNDGSWAPSISADGRFIAFQSEATNLVPGDTNGQIDVFVRDCADRADNAGERGERRRAEQRQQRRASERRWAVRPLLFGRSNLVPGDTNGSATCSCTTGRPDRRRG